MLQTCRQDEQREGLLQLINDLPSGITMAEIGCWRGESALLFLNSGKVNKFYAIDTWAHKYANEAEAEFDTVTKDMNVIKFKMTMFSAVNKLPDLDFVYIDGDHSYHWVKNDILSSLNVVKKGGMIGGHDYADKYSDRVVRAVNEILGIPDKFYVDSSWIKYIV
jgi:hypothetical protein